MHFTYRLIFRNLLVTLHKDRKKLEQIKTGGWNSFLANFSFSTLQLQTIQLRNLALKFFNKLKNINAHIVWKVLKECDIVHLNRKFTCPFKPSVTGATSGKFLTKSVMT
jgi:hypothetical protein